MKRLCGIVLATALVYGLAGCDRIGDPAGHGTQDTDVLEVEFAPVVRMPIGTTLDLVGTLLPIRATTVVSDVDGIIKSFPNSNRSLEFEENGQKMSVPLTLDLGHAVHEGDVLVQIDPVDFELALKVAEANRELAKRNLDDLKAWKRSEEVDQLNAALTEANAAFEDAERDLTRAKQAGNAISRAEYDNAVLARVRARAVKLQAEAALAIAKAGPTPQQLAVADAQVAAAQAEVDLKQEKLNKTTVHAPYDAVIADRYVSVGDRVTAMPRVEIMRIIDPRVLFAEVDVPERYQTKVKLDEMAVVTADGISQPVPARVEIINAMIDPETRTFRVRLTIDNRKQILKAGGFVHAALPIASASDVVAIPRQAVVFAEGYPAVFVFEPGDTDRSGQVRKVPVELGVSNENTWEITSGVSPGQLVAVERTSLLANGLPVQCKTEKQP